MNTASARRRFRAETSTRGRPSKRIKRDRQVSNSLESQAKKRARKTWVEVPKTPLILIVPLIFMPLLLTGKTEIRSNSLIRTPWAMMIR
jgi:hypothetical protein